MLQECAGIARQVTARGSAFARDAREEQRLYRSDNGVAGGINHRLAGTCRHGLGLPHAVCPDARITGHWSETLREK